MTQVALLEPKLFDAKSTEIADFVFETVLAADNDSEDDVQCKILGIKLLVAILQSMSESGISTDSETYTQKVHDLLFEKLEDENDDVRAASATSILKMSSIAKIKVELSTSQFASIGNVVRDSSLEVRKKVTKSLYRYLSHVKLSMRFAAVLLLGVADKDVEQAQNVKKYIASIIVVFRSLLAKTPDMTLDSDSAYELYPEYMLPHLIFLLAVHPNFNEEGPTYLAFQKYV